MKKYAYQFWLGLRTQLTQPSTWIGRVVLYVIILLVFSHLWRVATSSAPGLTLNAVDLTWYMALTELVVVAVPMLHLDLETEIRSGDVAYSLCRPASYLGMHIARGFGATLANMIFISIFGFAFVYLQAGSLPAQPLNLLFSLPLVICGGLLAVIALVAVGYSALWLLDASPLYWIWQKLLFVFGGLILPLQFYPDWMNTLANFTPFKAMLNLPATFVYEATMEKFSSILGQQLLWMSIFVVGLIAIHKMGYKRFQLSGG